MKNAAVTALSLSLVTLVSITAFAGKEEREYVKATVAPAIQDAETHFKAACGCPLQITFAESTNKTTNDMYVAKHVVDSITEGAPKYCIDAESKKAVCQLHTLEIGKGETTTFKFANGHGVSIHDGQGYYGWDAITRELDK